MTRLKRWKYQIRIFAASGLGISANCHGGIVWRFFVYLQMVIILLLLNYLKNSKCIFGEIYDPLRLAYDFLLQSNASRPSSAARRPSSTSSNTWGRKSNGGSQKSVEKPPSEKTKNIAQGLISKEEEYMLVTKKMTCLLFKTNQLQFFMSIVK